jgi:hypothetical protein
MNHHLVDDQSSSKIQLFPPGDQNSTRKLSPPAESEEPRVLARTRNKRSSDDLQRSSTDLPVQKISTINKVEISSSVRRKTDKANQYAFRHNSSKGQQKPRKRSFRTQMNEFEIINEFLLYTNCCDVQERRLGGYCNCLCSYFTYADAAGNKQTNYQELIAYIQHQRDRVRLKNEEEFDSFMIEKVKSSITSQKLKNGSTKFVMEYTLPHPDGEKVQTGGRFDNIIVCKTMFAKTFGSSKFQVESIIAKLKESGSDLQIKTSRKLRAFKDDTRHEYTYGVAEDIIINNLPQLDGGKSRKLLYFNANFLFLFYKHPLF